MCARVRVRVDCGGAEWAAPGLATVSGLGSRCWMSGSAKVEYGAGAVLRWTTGRDAVEGKGPQRRPEERLDRRVEEVGDGCCRLKCH